MYDIHGRFLDVNNAYCDLLGYRREDLLNMHVADIEMVESPEETTAHIHKIKEVGSDRFVTRHRCKDERVVDVEVSVTYGGAPRETFFMFIRDITERRRTENALLLEEETFRTIIENSPS
jgi:PAS domain S-box-containing protein